MSISALLLGLAAASANIPAAYQGNFMQIIYAMDGTCPDGDPNMLRVGATALAIPYNAFELDHVEETGPKSVRLVGTDEEGDVIIQLTLGGNGDVIFSQSFGDSNWSEPITYHRCK